MRLAPSLQATDPNLGWWVLNVFLVHFLSGPYFFPNNNFSFPSAQNMTTSSKRDGYIIMQTIKPIPEDTEMAHLFLSNGSNN
jgi:hypothetical protein